MSDRPVFLTRNGVALIPLHITAGLILSLFFTFIPLHIYELFGFIASSLCRSLVSITSLALAWMWGWLSDVTTSKKKILGLSMGGQAFFTMCFVFSDFLQGGIPLLAFFLLMYTLTSLFTSIYYPVKNAIITLMTREKGRGENVGVFFFFSSLGWGIGGYLNGYVLSLWTLGKTALLMGVLHLFALLFFLLIYREKEIEGEEPIKRGFLEGIQKMEPVLLWITLAIILISVGRGIFLPIFQIKMWIVFEKQSVWVGLITGLSGVAGAVGSFLYGKLSDHIGQASALTLGIIGNFVLFLLGVLNYQVTLAFVWIFPIWPLIAVSSVAIAANYSKATRRGEAQGVIRSARSFSGLFSFIGGVVAQFIGAAQDINRLTPFFLSLCIFPVLALLPLWKSKQLAKEHE